MKHSQRFAGVNALFSWVVCAVPLLMVAPARALQSPGACQHDWVTIFANQAGTDERLYALTVFDDGNGPALYASGNFAMAGGVVCNSIARWNGSSWSALGNGVNNYVKDQKEFDDGGGPALFVGGAFTTASGLTVNCITKWDGAHWSALGAGLNGYVTALNTFDGGGGIALYAGGSFTIAGSVAAQCIAKWNGASWSALGSGMNYKVRALTVFDDGGGPALHAGGFFTTASGSPANHIAKWNGTSWAPLANGTDGIVYALSPFDDGTGTALFAGGLFSYAGGFPANSIAKWGCPYVVSGTPYCTAGTTTNGCVASISGSGTPSASSAAGFTIAVSNVPGQTQGILFYGLDNLGVVPTAWGSSSSYLCVKPPSQRTSVLSSGGSAGACNGSLVIDWNAFIALNATAYGNPFVVGQRVYAQGWFRDPASPKTTMTSNGLEFLVGP